MDRFRLSGRHVTDGHEDFRFYVESSRVFRLVGAGWLVDSNEGGVWHREGSAVLLAGAGRGYLTKPFDDMLFPLSRYPEAATEIRQRSEFSPAFEVLLTDEAFGGSAHLEDVERDVALVLDDEDWSAPPGRFGTASVATVAAVPSVADAGHGRYGCVRTGGRLGTWTFVDDGPANTSLKAALDWAHQNCDRGLLRIDTDEGSKHFSIGRQPMDGYPEWTGE